MEKMMKLSILTVCLQWVLVVCNGIETPQFTVIDTESDFEIRLYKDSSWLSAPVSEISFEKATKLGFHRLYEYIHGANSDSAELIITAPILTSINTKSHEPDYFVRFYMPMKFRGVAPRPSPDLNLQFLKWNSHCVAIRKFPGFASDNNISKEVDALVTSLGRFQSSNSTTAVEEKHSYSIAQYSGPSVSIGRLNEVWIDVSGFAFTKEGCRSNY